MTTFPPRRGVRHAFTLLELLVVIGIIVILLGMLFPVINKVRYATYSANTSQEISQLQNAINQYYATFHAYPGPFSNDQIDNNTGGFSLEPYSVNNGTPTYGTAVTVNSGTAGALGKVNITGAQNLVLGLLGGLRIDPNTPNNPAFAPGEVGLGPLNLINAANSAYIPQRNPAFLNISAGGNTSLLMWSWAAAVPNNRSEQAPTLQFYPFNLTGFQDVSGNLALDAPIPVFVDRYPNPMPILYLRARTGVHGIISDGVMTDPSTSAAAAYEYDIREISPYTSTHIGLPVATTHDLVAQTGGFTFLNAAGTGPATVDGTGVNSAPDAGTYFYDPSFPLVSTQTTQNQDYNGRPRAVDSFILICAGPDGVYGTSDDICSFGMASH
jgi:prepilin-type N-terminal cleavage/methylation domain-containing protein